MYHFDYTLFVNFTDTILFKFACSNFLAREQFWLSPNHFDCSFLVSVIIHIQIIPCIFTLQFYFCQFLLSIFFQIIPSIEFPFFIATAHQTDIFTDMLLLGLFKIAFLTSDSSSAKEYMSLHFKPKLTLDCLCYFKAHSPLSFWISPLSLF